MKYKALYKAALKLTTLKAVCFIKSETVFFP